MTTSSRTARLSASRERSLRSRYPWTRAPLVVSAPMLVLAGPDLAVAVSRAGGLGFVGPRATPHDSDADMLHSRRLVAKSAAEEDDAARAPAARDAFYSSSLPVGVGFQLWNGDRAAAEGLVRQHRPCAAWLFAPRDGQTEVDDWADALRRAAPGIQVWLQVGTVREAAAAVAARSPPDVLVVQGAEAGGHGRAHDGLGLVTLVPEVLVEVGGAPVPVIAAGGLVDGRGAAAALSLGASGVALGTRFLASREARISQGYQQEVVRARDGAASTVRTQLYNHLRGTFGWPAPFSPRTIVNRSWHEHLAGVPFDELKRRHDAVAARAGDAAWGPDGRAATYAGASVGLVNDVRGARNIVRGIHDETRSVARGLAALLEQPAAASPSL